VFAQDRHTGLPLRVIQGRLRLDNLRQDSGERRATRGEPPGDAALWVEDCEKVKVESLID
jgi:hypothetical protein